MNPKTLLIDGSQGEGGGQVLRSSLTLSMISSKPISITNIRAKRSKPGLRPQHLKAVDAAAAISNAHVEGAFLNANSLEFFPSTIRSGRYKFKIGTAGSASLVLQTIFIPLSLANSASTTIISGGTHVPWSPCYHYLELHWLQYLREIGFDAKISIERAGFYPRGGGRITATIRPARRIAPLQLTNRGNLIGISGISAVANLPSSIADRQKRHALRRLQHLSSKERSLDVRIKTINLPSSEKGTLLLLVGKFEGGRCCFSSLGELGKPAEQVADEAVDALLSFLDTDGAIDHYLADQLILPLCLAEGTSKIRSSQITQHLLTNAEILRAFLPIEINIHGELGEPGLIQISPSTSNKMVT